MDNLINYAATMGALVVFNNNTGCGGGYLIISRSGPHIIYIDKNRPKCEQLATLAHEVGHAVCYAARCDCTRWPGLLAEAHADRWAIDYLHKHCHYNALMYLYRRQR